GRPTIGLSLVLISPTQPEQAQDLRDWADFVHIRHIAEVAVPGYTMITPYENATGGDPRFMHFYEMDTDEPERAFKSMTPFVIVRDPETRAAIGELTRKAWEEHGRAFSESRLSPKMLADVDKGATGGIAAAPVHVVVCADIERGLEVTIGSSIFPAVQNLLL